MKATMVTAAALVLGGALGCEDAERAARNDSMITNEVKMELADQHLPYIEVVTRGGVVTLNGVVPDAQAKSHAESAARMVAGVDGVINNLHETRAGDAPVRPPTAGAPTPREDEAPAEPPTAGAPTPPAEAPVPPPREMQ